MKLFAVLFALTQYALAVGPNDTTWIGFQRSELAHVPSAVQKATDSVFRIYFPTEPFDIVDFSESSKAEAVAEKYKGDKWSLMQLAYCRIQSIKKCPVSSIDHLGAGSAFVVHDVHTLATNLHNLHPWISAVVSNNLNGASGDLKNVLSQVMVPIMLSDRNGKIVVNPSEALQNNSFYQITKINSDQRLFRADVKKMGALFSASDYVELTFQKEFIQEPLKIANDLSQQVYVIGFPGPTKFFAEFGGGEGDGVHQMISTGQTQEQTTPILMSQATSQLLKDLLFESSASAYVGNSGGPAVNEKGQVVGILRSGDFSKGNDGLPKISSSLIRANYWDRLGTYWISPALQ